MPPFHVTYFTASGARYLFRVHGERTYVTRFVDDASHAATISLTNELVESYREVEFRAERGASLSIILRDGRCILSTAIRSEWVTPI